MVKHSYVIATGVVLVTLAILGVVNWNASPSLDPGDRASMSPVRLGAPPAYAATESFLADQAGITIYAKAEWLAGSPDWKAIQGRLKAVQKRGDGFLVGTIGGWHTAIEEYLPDPHVLVQEEGWIAAYFPANEPAARMMCHLRCKAANLLEWALQEAAAASTARLTDISYYHFGFPDANVLVIASRHDDGPMSMFFPSDITLMSVSVSANAHPGTDNRLSIVVNGDDVYRTSPVRINRPAKTIPTSLFEPDSYQEIEIGGIGVSHQRHRLRGYSIVTIARE